jgi:hypothetical protein
MRTNSRTCASIIVNSGIPEGYAREESELELP